MVRFAHDQVARVCYAAIRQLCEEQEALRPRAWEHLPSEERAWWVQSVQRARMGCLPRQIHESWRAELLDDGWRPGVVGTAADHDRKTHPSLVPWDEIDSDYRLRLVLLQMNATALTVDVPPVWETVAAVTAT